MYNYDGNFILHFELTNKCNARCVLCKRTVLDNNVPKQDPNLNLSEITLDNYKKIFYNNMTHLKYYTVLPYQYIPVYNNCNYLQDYLYNITKNYIYLSQ